MKLTTALAVLAVLSLTACKTTQRQPLTFNMTAEQLEQATPLTLCTDNETYILPDVQTTIKNRKINCEATLTRAYTGIASGLSNSDLCQTWMSSRDNLASKVVRKEVKSRNIDCPSIVAAQAQVDSVAAMEASNRQARAHAIQQSIQNQQAINAANRPRYSSCNAYGCTTY